jgi:hypothetical protein
MPEATLGRALLRTLEDLNALILKASDADVPRLRDQRRALIGRIEDLVEANLDRGSQEYAKATEGLQAASATIRDALAHLERVARAIETLGRALELVARVAAA